MLTRQIDTLDLGFLTFHRVPSKGATQKVTGELKYLLRNSKKFALLKKLEALCSTDFV